jgi:hypothetical protein
MIIGFKCNANTMTFTMMEDSKQALLDEISAFASVPVSGRRYPLRKFQQLAGWVNWALNVFPLLRPGLSNIYAKMEGKQNPNAPIFVNRAVIRDLMWLHRHIFRASGVHLLKSLAWDPADADVIVYCDASLSGMGFYDETACTGYQSTLPADAPEGNIFYFEAFCVCWALTRTVLEYPGTGKRVTIYTDSTNTFDIFNSLSATPLYNEILKAAVDVLIRHNVSLRVCLIGGKQNVVADALSRWDNATATTACPHLLIDQHPLPFIPFSPPRVKLGAAQQ